MRYELGSDRVVGKVIDGEAIVINLDTGYYYSLEHTGAAIWSHLSEGGSVQTLQVELATRYPEAKGAPAMAEALLSELVEAGLLRPTETDDTAPDVDWPDTFTDPVLIAYDDAAEMVALGEEGRRRKRKNLAGIPSFHSVEERERKKVIGKRASPENGTTKRCSLDLRSEFKKRETPTFIGIEKEGEKKAKNEFHRALYLL